MGAKNLILFGAFLVLLLGAIAASEGIEGPPGVPAGDVVIVEGAPPGISEISEEEFNQAMRRLAKVGGLERMPTPGGEEYERLMDEALSSLITSIWLQAEGEEMGLELSRAAMRTQRARDEFFVVEIENLLREEVPPPSRAEVAAYHEEGLARKLAGARVRLIAQRQQERYSEFDREFRDRWQPRTRCAEGFVIDSCGNYPPFAPSPLPGCNEPGEPPEGGCPAPVPQRYVAAPGSIAPFDPDGEALTQGPRPEGLAEAE